MVAFNLKRSDALIGYVALTFFYLIVLIFDNCFRKIPGKLFTISANCIRR
jgi:hypothetical protein